MRQENLNCAIVPERRCRRVSVFAASRGYFAAPVHFERRRRWAATGRHRKEVVEGSQVPGSLRGPFVFVGVTSLPSRLRGAGRALLSLAAQDRRPDRLILSLPRHSVREGLDYVLPPELRCVLQAHPWMEVNWVDEDYGPGTKLLGALQWLQNNGSSAHDSDVLMVLDDDHEYLPFAIESLLKEQLARSSTCVCSFFAYFCRGLMVPQGADIVAFRLNSHFGTCLMEYYRNFVCGDRACFVVDDLWVAMFFRLIGYEVVSLRDQVVRRGLQMVYSRTSNASVQALMDLGGEDRRDRATITAFDGLLSRLLSAGREGSLSMWGGAEALQRLQRLDHEVKHAEREIAGIAAWLQDQGDCGDSYSEKAKAKLSQLQHLYQMRVAGI